MAIVSLAFVQLPFFFFQYLPISAYSCVLDERLSGDSDGRHEKQLYNDLRAPYSLQTSKYSSLYVLIEVAAAGRGQVRRHVLSIYRKNLLCRVVRE